MDQMTVRGLYEELKCLMQLGYGDRKIVLPDDNEGNGFHGCFFGCTTNKNYIEMATDGLIFDSEETDPSKIIIIG